MFYPKGNFTCTDENCVFPIVLAYVILAISSSMMTVFWSCVPLIVEENLQPTAYGIMLSLENGIGFLQPPVAGIIIDLYPDDPATGYYWATAFVTGLVFISFLFTIAL